MTTVAQAACVSRSWLYRQTDLHLEIARHRHSSPTLPVTERATNESQHQRIEDLHDEVNRLNTENAALRQQLAERYGQQRAHEMLK